MLCKRSPASTHASPRPGTEETTPLGPGLFTEPEDKPKNAKVGNWSSRFESRVPVPSLTSNRKKQIPKAAQRFGEAEKRGLDGPWPGPSPLSSPNSNNSSGNPLADSAPPTPRPRRALLPSPRVRQRPPRSTTRFPEPRQPSLQPRAGRGPRAPAPTRPAAVPVRSPGHSPSARTLVGVKARVGRRGPPGCDPGRSPYSEPMEALRLCLQGLSLARTLEKHFRGRGGGKGFGTGTARGLELPGPPGRGGAGRGLSRQTPANPPAGRVYNPFWSPSSRFSPLPTSPPLATAAV